MCSKDLAGLLVIGVQEVTTFCFVPASQNRLYLVAGLLTGQVSLRTLTNNSNRGEAL